MFEGWTEGSSLFAVYQVKSTPSERAEVPPERLPGRPAGKSVDNLGIVNREKNRCGPTAAGAGAAGVSGEKCHIQHRPEPKKERPTRQG